MNMNNDKNWSKKMADLEDGCIVSVGGLVDSMERKGPVSQSEQADCSGGTAPEEPRQIRDSEAKLQRAARAH